MDQIAYKDTTSLDPLRSVFTTFLTAFRHEVYFESYQISVRRGLMVKHTVHMPKMITKSLSCLDVKTIQDSFASSENYVGTNVFSPTASYRRSIA